MRPAIERASRAALPREACGLLLGHVRSGVLDVRRAEPARNAEQQVPEQRFEIAPDDWLRLERAAQAMGLEVLGVWHSHPTGPACPSALDERADLGGLVSLILGAVDQTPRLRAWARHGDGLRELDLRPSASAARAGVASPPPTP